MQLAAIERQVACYLQIAGVKAACALNRANYVCASLQAGNRAAMKPESIDIDCAGFGTSPKSSSAGRRVGAGLENHSAGINIYLASLDACPGIQQALAR